LGSRDQEIMLGQIANLREEEKEIEKPAMAVQI
jgi:hypothetical protein